MDRTPSRSDQRVPPMPSGPVHPVVIQRQRATSAWLYEFCEKYGVDGPEDATPEQEAEYERGVEAVYERFRSEASKVRKALRAEWSEEFCRRHGVTWPWLATDEQIAEYESGLDGIYAANPDQE